MSKPSKRTRETFVTLLQRARDPIASGQCPYICWAVEGVAETDDERKAAKQLTRRINALLNVGRPPGTPRVTTYWGWLVAHRFTAPPDDLREGRLAWIDHLINEFKD